MALITIGDYHSLMNGMESLLSLLSILLFLVAAERWWRTGHA